MNVKRQGIQIYHRAGPEGLWRTHTMAPAPVLINNDIIRVFVGGWDENRISRIWYIDVSAKDPTQILGISGSPVIDLGVPGAFDDNGVFPGHIYKHGHRYLLYYTGFQLGQKVRYFNFGGLAVSDDGEHFTRVSHAPVLDRADEGLTVRAGQSVIWDSQKFRSCYSAGGSWMQVGGETRPIYDVYYQESDQFDVWKRRGVRIVECDRASEHGLGRPQIVKAGGRYFVFYTRRTLNMKYHMGAAISDDCVAWRRIDGHFAVEHSHSGFDDEMVYFPAVIFHEGNFLLFYSGNEFGRGGLGFCRIELP